MLKTILIVILVTYLLLTFKYVNRVSPEKGILNVDFADFTIERLQDRQPIYIKSIDDTDYLQSLLTNKFTVFYDKLAAQNELRQNYSDGIILHSSSSKEQTVYLFDPTQEHNLYPMNYSDIIKKWELDSQIDITNPDLKAFPKYSNSEYTSVILQPGDAIYIPFQWWYMIEEDSDSIKTIKWNSYLSVLIRPLFIAYKYATR